MSISQQNNQSPIPWHFIYGRELSATEQQEVKTNLGGVFDLLHEWTVQEEANESEVSTNDP